jgi:hypothetical protein
VRLLARELLATRSDLVANGAFCSVFLEHDLVERAMDAAPSESAAVHDPP